MKFAVTGPLADKNLGDYAMFVNNIYDLGDAHDYSVFHYSGDFVKQLDKDYFKRFNCNYTEVEFNKSFYTKPKFSTRIFRKLLSYIDIELPFKNTIPVSSEILARVNNLEQIEEVIKGCDSLIVSGGGYFNKLWFEWARRDDLFKILVPILVAKKHNKKIFFTANGYGPFDESDKYFCDFFGIIPDASLGVRDKLLSKVYLNRLGVSDENITYLPDDLYIVNEALTKDSIMQESGDYIVLEFYYGLEWAKKNLKLIENFIDEVWHKHKCRVVYMPFDHTPVADFLKSNINNEHFSVWDIDDYLKIEDAIYIIKNAKAVLCNRYHALVLSLQNKVPVINIMKEVYDFRYYYNKNSGVLANTFDGLLFDENIFLKIGAEEAFPWFSKNIDVILKAQNQLYSTETYTENKLNLAKARYDFLNIILTKDTN